MKMYYLIESEKVQGTMFTFAERTWSAGLRPRKTKVIINKDVSKHYELNNGADTECKYFLMCKESLRKIKIMIT